MDNKNKIVCKKKTTRGGGVKTCVCATDIYIIHTCNIFIYTYLWFALIQCKGLMLTVIMKWMHITIKIIKISTVPLLSINARKYVNKFKIIKRLQTSKYYNVQISDRQCLIVPFIDKYIIVFNFWMSISKNKF